MVDMLRDSGAFTPEEAQEYVELKFLNGLFVVARSIGFVGHFLDQKRLRAPLYRHPGEFPLVSSIVMRETLYLTRSFFLSADDIHLEVFQPDRTLVTPKQ